MKFKKILIAVDDTAYSMKAAKLGFELAHTLKAKIGVVYVVDRAHEVVNADLGILPEESKLVLLQEAENIIDQLVKMYDGIDQIYKFTPEGTPEKEIVNIASQWGADLIVMGTHSRSGLNRLLNGSVTEYVIRHIDIPVIVTHLKSD